MKESKKAYFRDRDLAAQVKKAELDGSDLSVIILYKDTVKLDQVEALTQNILQQASETTRLTYRDCFLLKNMECFAIKCGSAYLKHLVIQPQVDTVVLNTHDEPSLSAITSKRL
jgi:hypothetical protein